MKKQIALLGIIATLFGCEKDDTSDSTPILQNCAVEYLDFKDEMRYGAVNGILIPADSRTLSFVVEKGRYVKVQGGVVAMAAGTSFSWAFNTGCYETLTYEGSSVKVFSSSELTFYAKDNPKNPTIYSFDSKGRLDKVTQRNGNTVSYQYQADVALEKDASGNTLRTFSFSNGNLVKVEKLWKNTEGVVIQKEEMLFEGFDSHPNPFKGKHYVLGAFYRAFSNSNFTKRTVNTYILQDGALVKRSTATETVEIRYDANGNPLLGEYR